MGKRIDLVGHTYERLYVKSFNKFYQGCTYWNCVCTCGKKTIVRSWSLRSGEIKSCGCLGAELSRKRKSHYFHGYSNTSEYHTWNNMIRRCSPGKDCSKNYYDRGIRVCKQWVGKDGLITFYRDVGPKPDKEFSLDRINNDGNYEPGNVRWADKKTQSLNKRAVKVITNFSDEELLHECRRRNFLVIKKRKK